MYLTQALHRAVQQKPDQIATRCAGRERTFRQLGERVARLAGALQALGMQPGDRVGILALNADRYLEYQMGVPWAGGVLNPCNTRWAAAEILYALNDSGTSILLVDDTFSALVQGLRHEASTLREVIHCGDGPTPADMHDYEALLARAAPAPDAVRRGNDLAAIFYTGGTTGFPKGVMLSHGNILASAFAMRCEEFSRPGGTFLHVAPMFHVADFGVSMPHWLDGNTHSAIPAFSPPAVLDAIERDHVTHTLLVPTMIQMLVDHPEMKSTRDLSSLEAIVYGASPISQAVLERAMHALPGVAFMQAYGMTELSPTAAVLRREHHLAEARQRGLLRSAGRATLCTEIRIVDPNDEEAPRGQVGEVVARGASVMLGYWNQPQQTEQALRGGWMHTGDGGYMDEQGFIYIVDRMKDIIISGGENVYSNEVENALARHPQVSTCAVIGIPDDTWGESVHAVVVLKPEAEVSAEELIAHCKQLIAGYKCPRSIEFRDALPLSGAGKVLKIELRKPFWADRTRRIN